jgi:ABC-type sugar transport system ATPase subunit
MTMGDRVAVMRRRILQQVDTPPNLCNSPANVFANADLLAIGS